MKNFLTNSLTVVAALTIALFISEGAVRLFREKPTEYVFPDPVIGERVVSGPGWDENGFFNLTVPERIDVLAIGDSMTQGYGVQYAETWPTVFGSLASTSVYQLGLWGSGSLDYLYRFDNYGVQLKPKLVIVAFYVGNDLYDAQRLAYGNDFFQQMRDPAFAANEEPITDPALRAEVTAGMPRESFSYKIFQMRLYVRNHSQLYALLGDATRSMRERFDLALTDDEKLDQVKALAEKDPSIAFVYDKYPEITTVLSPSYRLNAVDLSYPSTKEGWRLTKESFLMMASTARTMGSEFVIVAIPTKEQTYLKFMREDEGMIPDAFTQYEKTEDILLDAFSEFCNKERMHCVSLLPHLVEGLKAKKTMFKPVLDGHPYPLGYREFAVGIHEHLKGEKLLPLSQ